jgi:cell division protein FtsA
MVITGGGSQMKHIGQLFEYVTGMDTRIGYPNEYLANGNADEITSPMYATGVGLILKGFEKLERQKGQKKNIEQEDSIKVRQGEKTKGGFLQSMLAKGKQFFEEDES